MPVIRQAEQRSFVDLARSLADLANRARTKKLMPEETSGSTFTLTNAGIFGGELSGPPSSTSPSRPSSPSEASAKSPSSSLTLKATTPLPSAPCSFTLGFDHRLIDGADS